MKLNKTQEKLIDRLQGKYGSGNCKEGWSKLGNVLTIQKFSEIDQAYKLAQAYPEKFKTHTLAFKLVKLELLSEV